MKQPLILAILGVLLIVAGCIKFNDSKDQADQLTGKDSGFSPDYSEPERVELIAKARRDNDQDVSLKEMSFVISEYVRPNKNEVDLVGFLKATAQSPYLVKDSNEFTGEMIIVRTKSPLPGTRYFHAQYMENEFGKKFLQHMSFEFRPGNGAMEMATAALKDAFGNLSQPRYERNDFVQWDLDGYSLWVKQLALEDLNSEDPFNAYAPNDIGTIRIAIEVNPHDGHDH